MRVEIDYARTSAEARRTCTRVPFSGRADMVCTRSPSMRIAIIAAVVFGTLSVHPF